MNVDKIKPIKVLTASTWLECLITPVNKSSINKQIFFRNCLLLKHTFFYNKCISYKFYKNILYSNHLNLI